MCMSEGAPKKPEFGPCQEQHSLSAPVPLGNLNDIGELMKLMFYVSLMAPLVDNLLNAYSNFTTAATTTAFTTTLP